MSCATCLPCVFASVENFVRPKKVMTSVLSSDARNLAGSVDPASSSARWRMRPAANPPAEWYEGALLNIARYALVKLSLVIP